MTMMIYNRNVSSRRPLRLSIRIRIREIRWYGVILGTEESVERFFGEREREEDERSSKQPSNRFVGLNRLKGVTIESDDEPFPGFGTDRVKNVRT